MSKGVHSKKPKYGLIALHNVEKTRVFAYKKFPTRVVKFLIFFSKTFFGNSFLDIYNVQKSKMENDVQI